MTTSPTHRTRTTLADGRDLFYYDIHPAAGRDRFDDKREPTPRSAAAEMRFDPLADEWVAVAAARQSRPMLPPTTECPLCPSTPEHSTEIPAPDYEVVVFENRFPSFGGDLAGDSPVIAPDLMDPAAPRPITATRPAIGRCEVVCFTSDHDSSFANLRPDQARLVVDALADRTAELSRLDSVKQVFCYENRGEEIGVTLHHPHGQIYGYPYITPTTRRMLGAVARHAPGDLFADILTTELDSPRVVARHGGWTAFVPAAARWPFEVHLYPDIRVPDLPALPSAYRDSFASLYLDVLRAFDKLFDLPMPYVSGWQQAPVHTGRDSWYLHMRLYSVRRAPGKLKYLAGSESAMGAFINDVPPEKAAAMLRDALA